MTDRIVALEAAVRVKSARFVEAQRFLTGYRPKEMTQAQLIDNRLGVYFASSP